MDIYKLDNSYTRQEIIDAYESVIWTERFKGDGDFELHLPVENSLVPILPTGTLLECEGSEQPMVIEDIDTENNVAKFTGITITKWMNNRFIRSSDDYTVKGWDVTDVPIGELIADIVQKWCVDSPYLSSGAMGFDATYLILPGSTVSGHAIVDSAGVLIPNFTGAIEFGPVYDKIRALADQAGVGIKTILHTVGGGRGIAFSSYSGQNKAVANSSGKILFFSPTLESLINVKELQSETDHSNEVYMFLPEVSDFASHPEYDAGYVWTNWTFVHQNGQSRFNATPWDIRVRQEFSGISQDDFDAMPPPWDGITPPFRTDTVIDTELKQFLIDHAFAHLIDGEISSLTPLEYGTDFNLGDIVAMQGYSKDIIAGQITEFIRSKDASGEKAFPTVESYPGYNVVWESEYLD